MTWLYAFQFALPLILIGWLVWLPARSALGFAVQAFASAAALAVMALQGIWLLPPWWAPLVFAAALGVAAWLGRRRVRPFSSAVPRSSGAWIVMVLFVGLGATSTYGTVHALRSRAAPAAGVVNLAFPLETGRYLVVNGGSNSSTNAHLETLDPEVPRYRAWRGQSYGVDIVALGPGKISTRTLAAGAKPISPSEPSACVTSRPCSVARAVTVTAWEAAASGTEASLAA